MSLLGNINFVSNYSLFGANSRSYSNPYSNYQTGSSSSSSIYALLNMQYGVNNAKGSSAVSSTVRELGNGMSGTISSLTTTGSKSLFNKTGASSSESKVATATVDNAKFDESKNAQMELDVKQTAKAQVNSGSAVKAANKDVLSGTYGFEIEINGKKQQFSVNVTASDTNESIQKKMAETINGKNIGVTASVSYDSTTKTSKLSLAATDTGNKNADGGPVFTVTDTRGALASKMGVTQISQNAQNAVYTVNGGEEKTSVSNSVDLGNGVTATLKGTGKTTLTFQKDGSGSIDKVKELVNTLNSALAAAYNSDGRGSDRLGQDITSMNKSYKSTLEKVGINVSPGGMLSVDEDKLKKAAENGSLEKLFQGRGNYGFVNRASHIANNMGKTNLYADQVANTQNNYTNYSSSGVYNYNQFSSAGSLLDALF